MHNALRNATRNAFRYTSFMWPVMFAGLTACSLSDLLNGSQATSGNTDPGLVRSYTGALGMYYSSIAAARDGVSSDIANVALFTDELYESIGAQNKGLDGRVAPATADGGIVPLGAYANLQAARVQAAQASAALLQYGTPVSYPLVGHAYALQAHAITLLAEMFCSGVPITDVPLGGELHYSAGLSTTALLERAVALFDTAYQYGKDSLPIATFAKVGKGRALLDLGRYADAGAAVSDVATTAQYILEFDNNNTFLYPTLPLNFERHNTLSPEGINGIRWAALSPALQDPRVPFETNGSTFVDPLREAKYTQNSVNLALADGIQARMIEAEAQLQPADAPSGPWLQTLNALRHTIGVSDTTDPGTKDGRINLLFRERAFWFYLNGHRLSDMRRLVRQYGRPATQVYPVGAYPNPDAEVATYGTEVVFVPPVAEQQSNPLYKGCINKGA